MLIRFRFDSAMMNFRPACVAAHDVAGMGRRSFVQGRQGRSNALIYYRYNWLFYCLDVMQNTAARLLLSILWVLFPCLDQFIKPGELEVHESARQR